MRRLSFVLLVGGLFAASGFFGRCADDFKPEPGYVSLFNARTSPAGVTKRTISTERQ